MLRMLTCHFYPLSKPNSPKCQCAKISLFFILPLRFGVGVYAPTRQG